MCHRSALLDFLVIKLCWNWHSWYNAVTLLFWYITSSCSDGNSAGQVQFLQPVIKRGMQQIRCNILSNNCSCYRMNLMLEWLENVWYSLCGSERPREAGDKIKPAGDMFFLQRIHRDTALIQPSLCAEDLGLSVRNLQQHECSVWILALSGSFHYSWILLFTVDEVSSIWICRMDDFYNALVRGKL